MYIKIKDGVVCRIVVSHQRCPGSSPLYLWIHYPSNTLPSRKDFSDVIKDLKMGRWPWVLYIYIYARVCACIYIYMCVSLFSHCFSIYVK